MSASLVRLEKNILAKDNQTELKNSKELCNLLHCLWLFWPFWEPRQHQEPQGTRALSKGPWFYYSKTALFDTQKKSARHTVLSKWKGNLITSKLSSFFPWGGLMNFSKGGIVTVLSNCMEKWILTSISWYSSHTCTYCIIWSILCILYLVWTVGEQLAHPAVCTGKFYCNRNILEQYPDAAAGEVFALIMESFLFSKS